MSPYKTMTNVVASSHPKTVLSDSTLSIQSHRYAQPTLLGGRELPGITVFQRTLFLLFRRICTFSLEVMNAISISLRLSTFNRSSKCDTSEKT